MGTLPAGSLPSGGVFFSPGLNETRIQPRLPLRLVFLSRRASGPKARLPIRTSTARLAAGSARTVVVLRRIVVLDARLVPPRLRLCGSSRMRPPRPPVGRVLLPLPPHRFRRLPLRSPWLRRRLMMPRTQRLPLDLLLHDYLSDGSVGCTQCGRSFKTAAGCSLHLRKAHPQVFHAHRASLIAASTRGVGRWTGEEDAYLLHESESWPSHRHALLALDLCFPTTDLRGSQLQDQAA